MSALQKSLLIFLGAGIGGNARYWIGGWIGDRLGATFPWGTFLVNVSGCLLIGLVSGLLLGVQDPLPWRLLIVIGLLGGYTTFSSFSYETVNLLTEGSFRFAALNAFGSCAAGFAATWLGVTLVRMLLRG